MTELAVYFHRGVSRGWAHFLNPFDPSPDAVASVAVGSRFFSEPDRLWWPMIVWADHVSQWSIWQGWARAMEVDGAMFSMRNGKELRNNTLQSVVYVYTYIHTYTYIWYQHVLYILGTSAATILGMVAKMLFLRDSKQCVPKSISGCKLAGQEQPY